jgi:hypothetical protein
MLQTVYETVTKYNDSRTLRNQFKELTASSLSFLGRHVACVIFSDHPHGKPFVRTLPNRSGIIWLEQTLLS